LFELVLLDIKIGVLLLGCIASLGLGEVHMAIEKAMLLWWTAAALYEQQQWQQQRHQQQAMYMLL
jgi:hypothetical protein